jgi:hypothetical protein
MMRGCVMSPLADRYQEGGGRDEAGECGLTSARKGYDRQVLTQLLIPGSRYRGGHTCPMMGDGRELQYA